MVSKRPDLIDLIGPEFDRPSAEPARRTLIICSPPRTESWELARHLIAAGIGVPHEYFNPNHARRFAERCLFTEDPLSETGAAALHCGVAPAAGAGWRFRYQIAVLAIRSLPAQSNRRRAIRGCLHRSLVSTGRGRPICVNGVRQSKVGCGISLHDKPRHRTLASTRGSRIF